MMAKSQVVMFREPVLVGHMNLNYHRLAPFHFILYQCHAADTKPVTKKN